VLRAVPSTRSGSTEYCAVQKRAADKAVLSGMKFRMQNNFVTGIHEAAALSNVRELRAAWSCDMNGDRLNTCCSDGSLAFSFRSQWLS
jgi:hypothetical protein